MAWRPALQQPAPQKASFDIELAEVLDYDPAATNETRLKVEGQPRRAWLETTEFKGQSRVVVSYVLPIDGLALPMKLAVWKNPSGQGAPANAITVKDSDLVLIADDEFILELSTEHIKHGELPTRKRHTPFTTSRLICQARLVANGGRNLLVYTSRIPSNREVKRDYCIAALSSGKRDQIEGAIRIHDGREPQQSAWHYYAVPVEALW